MPGSPAVFAGIGLAFALGLPPAIAQAAGGSQLEICGARIEVGFEGPAPDLPREAFLSWIGAAARATTRYFGRFPVARYRVQIVVSEGDGVRGGRTWGYGGAHTEIRIGRHVREAQLSADWVLTHEMIHVAFPNVGDDRPWIQEGVATYVEPLARSFVGDYPLRSVWADLVEGLPKGMPSPGGPGLDQDHSWGRTYWGGALFFGRADVEIRRRTENRLGLIDALRGILAAGGNNQVSWSAAHAFAVGDAATGVDVLERLWSEMGPKPVAPDLDLFWSQLGVPRQVGGSFDDRAPEAAIRRAIGAAPAEPACSGSP